MWSDDRYPAFASTVGVPVHDRTSEQFPRNGRAREELTARLEQPAHVVVAAAAAGDVVGDPVEGDAPVVGFAHEVEK